MTEEQVLAVKKFLYSVKNAVMAMDINSLKEDAIAEVYNSFCILIEEATSEESSSSSSGSAA